MEEEEEKRGSLGSEQEEDRTTGQHTEEWEAQRSDRPSPAGQGHSESNPEATPESFDRNIFGQRSQLHPGNRRSSLPSYPSFVSLDQSSSASDFSGEEQGSDDSDTDCTSGMQDVACNTDLSGGGGRGSIIGRAYALLGAGRRDLAADSCTGTSSAGPPFSSNQLDHIATRSIFSSGYGRPPDRSQPSGCRYSPYGRTEAERLQSHNSAEGVPDSSNLQFPGASSSGGRESQIRSRVPSRDGDFEEHSPCHPFHQSSSSTRSRYHPFRPAREEAPGPGISGTGLEEMMRTRGRPGFDRRNSPNPAAAAGRRLQEEREDVRSREAIPCVDPCSRMGFPSDSESPRPAPSWTNSTPAAAARPSCGWNPDVVFRRSRSETSSPERLLVYGEIPGSNPRDERGDDLQRHGEHLNVVRISGAGPAGLAQRLFEALNQAHRSSAVYQVHSEGSSLPEEISHGVSGMPSSGENSGLYHVLSHAMGREGGDSQSIVRETWNPGLTSGRSTRSPADPNRQDRQRGERETSHLSRPLIPRIPMEAFEDPGVRRANSGNVTLATQWNLLSGSRPHVSLHLLRSASHSGTALNLPIGFGPPSYGQQNAAGVLRFQSPRLTPARFGTEGTARNARTFISEEAGRCALRTDTHRRSSGEGPLTPQRTGVRGRLNDEGFEQTRGTSARDSPSRSSTLCSGTGDEENPRKRQDGGTPSGSSPSRPSWGQPERVRLWKPWESEDERQSGGRPQVATGALQPPETTGPGDQQNPREGRVPTVHSTGSLPTGFMPLSGRPVQAGIFGAPRLFGVQAVEVEQDARQGSYRCPHRDDRDVQERFTVLSQRWYHFSSSADAHVWTRRGAPSTDETNSEEEDPGYEPRRALASSLSFLVEFQKNNLPPPKPQRAPVREGRERSGRRWDEMETDSRPSRHESHRKRDRSKKEACRRRAHSMSRAAPCSWKKQTPAGGSFQGSYSGHFPQDTREERNRLRGEQRSSGATHTLSRADASNRERMNPTPRRQCKEEPACSRVANEDRDGEPAARGFQERRRRTRGSTDQKVHKRRRREKVPSEVPQAQEAAPSPGGNSSQDRPSKKEAAGEQSAEPSVSDTPNQNPLREPPGTYAGATDITGPESRMEKPAEASRQADQVEGVEAASPTNKPLSTDLVAEPEETQTIPSDGPNAPRSARNSLTSSGRESGNADAEGDAVTSEVQRTQEGSLEGETVAAVLEGEEGSTAVDGRPSAQPLQTTEESLRTQLGAVEKPASLPSSLSTLGKWTDETPEGTPQPEGDTHSGETSTIPPTAARPADAVASNAAKDSTPGLQVVASASSFTRNAPDGKESSSGGDTHRVMQMKKCSPSSLEIVISRLRSRLAETKAGKATLAGEEDKTCGLEDDDDDEDETSQDLSLQRTGNRSRQRSTRERHLPRRRDSAQERRFRERKPDVKLEESAVGGDANPCSSKTSQPTKRGRGSSLSIANSDSVKECGRGCGGTLEEPRSFPSGTASIVRDYSLTPAEPSQCRSSSETESACSVQSGVGADIDREGSSVAEETVPGNVGTKRKGGRSRKGKVGTGDVTCTKTGEGLQTPAAGLLEGSVEAEVPMVTGQDVGSSLTRGAPQACTESTSSRFSNTSAAEVEGTSSSEPSTLVTQGDPSLITTQDTAPRSEIKSSPTGVTAESKSLDLTPEKVGSSSAVRSGSSAQAHELKPEHQDEPTASPVLVASSGQKTQSFPRSIGNVMRNLFARFFSKNDELSEETNQGNCSGTPVDDDGNTSANEPKDSVVQLPGTSSSRTPEKRTSPSVLSDQQGRSRNRRRPRRKYSEVNVDSGNVHPVLRPLHVPQALTFSTSGSTAEPNLVSVAHFSPSSTVDDWEDVNLDAETYHPFSLATPPRSVGEGDSDQNMEAAVLVHDLSWSPGDDRSSTSSTLRPGEHPQCGLIAAMKSEQVLTLSTGISSSALGLNVRATALTETGCMSSLRSRPSLLKDTTGAESSSDDDEEDERSSGLEWSSEDETSDDDMPGKYFFSSKKASKHQRHQDTPPQPAASPDAPPVQRRNLPVVEILEETRSYPEDSLYSFMKEAPLPALFTRCVNDLIDEERVLACLSSASVQHQSDDEGTKASTTVPFRAQRPPAFSSEDESTDSSSGVDSPESDRSADIPRTRGEPCVEDRGSQASWASVVTSGPDRRNTSRHEAAGSDVKSLTSSEEQIASPATATSGRRPEGSLLQASTALPQPSTSFLQPSTSSRVVRHGETTKQASETARSKPYSSTMRAAKDPQERHRKCHACMCASEPPKKKTKASSQPKEVKKCKEEATNSTRISSASASRKKPAPSDKKSKLISQSNPSIDASRNAKGIEVASCSSQKDTSVKSRKASRKPSKSEMPSAGTQTTSSHPLRKTGRKAQRDIPEMEEKRKLTGLASAALQRNSSCGPSSESSQPRQEGSRADAKAETLQRLILFVSATTVPAGVPQGTLPEETAMDPNSRCRQRQKSSFLTCERESGSPANGRCATPRGRSGALPRNGGSASAMPPGCYERGSEDSAVHPQTAQVRELGTAEGCQRVADQVPETSVSVAAEATRETAVGGNGLPQAGTQTTRSPAPETIGSSSCLEGKRNDVPGKEAGQSKLPRQRSSARKTEREKSKFPSPDSPRSKVVRGKRKASFAGGASGWKKPKREDDPSHPDGDEVSSPRKKGQLPKTETTVEKRPIPDDEPSTSGQGRMMTRSRSRKYVRGQTSAKQSQASRDAREVRPPMRFGPYRPGQPCPKPQRGRAGGDDPKERGVRKSGRKRKPTHTQTREENSSETENEEAVVRRGKGRGKGRGKKRRRSSSSSLRAEAEDGRRRRRGRSRNRSSSPTPRPRRSGRRQSTGSRAPRRQESPRPGTSAEGDETPGGAAQDPSRARFSCPRCQHLYATRETLRRHLMLVHELNARETMNHMETFQTRVVQTFDQPLSCPLCVTVFHKKITLKRHVIKKHRPYLGTMGDNFSSILADCLRTTDDNHSQIPELLANPEPVTLFKCPVCGRDYCSSGNLCRHLKLTHGKVLQYERIPVYLSAEESSEDES